MTRAHHWRSARPQEPMARTHWKKSTEKTPELAVQAVYKGTGATGAWN